jgi:DNA gyrase, A subunit|nr:MAG TPA: DNA topoisomerase 2 beta [Caudoviricetes sp.]
MSKKNKQKKKKLGVVKDIDIVNILKDSMTSYMNESNYRMLPSVIDGLKPIQRKILFSMYKTKIFSYDKNSSITGDVAKYLVTGDDSVYPALIVIGQTFRNRYSPIEIHGNQGYIISDKVPAAKRYTESRLSQYALDWYFDEDFYEGDFMYNYNQTLKEPIVLPTLLPMALIQRTKGTGSGFTNEVLPHSLESVAKCYIRFIETLSGKYKWENLEKYIIENIKLDIPNKSKLVNPEAVAKGLLSGKGKIYLEGKVKSFQASYGRPGILITELPYEYCVSSFMDNIKGHSFGKEYVSEINDLSDGKHGIEIEFIFKKDTDPKQIKEFLYLKGKFKQGYNYSMHYTMLLTESDKLIRRLNIIDIFGHHYRYKSKVTERFLLNKKDKLAFKFDCLSASSIIFTDPKNKKKFFKILEESTKSNIIRSLTRAFSIKVEVAEYLLDRKMWNLVHNAEDIKKELDSIEKELRETEKNLKSIDKYIINKIKSKLKNYQ